MATAILPTGDITDWTSFHATCQRVLGFPAFYGANMNAWIDCLTYLDEGDGMSRFELGASEVLVIEVPEAIAFRDRLPEIFAALLECAAFVNQRYVDAGNLPRLALLLR
jgi:hypothetical protein